MNKLHEALDFFIRHQTALGFSAVSLLTAASERIFSSVVFRCPCNSGNMVYGSFFLLVPAFILLLLGYMVNNRSWRRLTGCCSREKECSPSETCSHFCRVLVPMTARALVAPLTWIAVALLGANFYECAASGSSLTKRLFCKHNETDCQEKLFKIPWLIGWFLIASIMTVALISKCVSRYCSSVSYLQLKYRKIYSKEEKEVFEIKAKEHATKLAETNTNCFFETKKPTEKPPLVPVPSIEEWREISLLCTHDSQEVYYHKIFETEKGGQSTGSNEGGQGGTVPPSEGGAQAGDSGLQ